MAGFTDYIRAMRENDRKEMQKKHITDEEIAIIDDRFKDVAWGVRKKKNETTMVASRMNDFEKVGGGRWEATIETFFGHEYADDGKSVRWEPAGISKLNLGLDDDIKDIMRALFRNMDRYSDERSFVFKGFMSDAERKDFEKALKAYEEEKAEYLDTDDDEDEDWEDGDVDEDDITDDPRWFEDIKADPKDALIGVKIKIL